MKCEEFALAAEEYFDGELNERASERLRVHLNSCAACARAYAELGREQEAYLQYQREIELPPALWAATQARLAAERARRAADRPQQWRHWLAGALAAPRLSPALTAALMLLAIGLTAGIMRFAQTLREDAPRAARQAHHDPRHDPRADAPAPATALTPAPAGAEISRAAVEMPAPDSSDSAASSAPERSAAGARRSDWGRPAAVRVRSESGLSRPPSPEELVREAARTYEAAIALLQRDADQRRTEIDSATRERFDRALAAIDLTIAETRRAVRENPGDPVAARYMQAAYVRKIEVLRELTDY